MNSSLALFGQLLTIVPVLLVYVGGLIVCAMLRRRAPKAATLAMIGIGLLLLTAVGGRILTLLIIQNRAASQTVGMALSIIGIGSSIFHAAGFALVLAAVFAQRESQSQQRGFEVSMGTPIHGQRA